MDILYKVMFSTLPSIYSGVWYSILIDNGINVLQNPFTDLSLSHLSPTFVCFRKFIFTDTFR